MANRRDYTTLGHSRLNAPERLGACESAFRSLGIAPRRVLDVGGTGGSAAWLRDVFPEAEIAVLNNSPFENDALPPGVGFVLGDAQAIPTGERYDMVYAGEVIEHLWNPDGFLDSASAVVADHGWLIVTTPNLACLANRLFLLFGWTPGNISPSIRYITGNPVLPEGTGEIGTIAHHKSVFTLGGFRRLAELYGFQLRRLRGFSYAPEPGQKRWGLGGREVQSSGYGLRRTMNSVLPHSLREGMALLFEHRPETRKAAELVYPPDVTLPVFQKVV
ncbi:MAG TPA: methyltransferase domain-containing protein [Thermoanaerobaculia bacterium]|nr:methyltransferase domain-containing protein [Thermoanaerobaculia bacterium]